jgi:hypothetical protein
VDQKQMAMKDGAGNDARLTLWLHVQPKTCYGAVAASRRMVRTVRELFGGREVRHRCVWLFRPCSPPLRRLCRLWPLAVARRRGVRGAVACVRFCECTMWCSGLRSGGSAAAARARVCVRALPCRWWCTQTCMHAHVRACTRAATACPNTSATQPYHIHTKIMLKEPRSGGGFNVHQGALARTALCSGARAHRQRACATLVRMHARLVIRR